MQLNLLSPGALINYHCTYVPIFNLCCSHNYFNGIPIFTVFLIPVYTWDTLRSFGYSHYATETGAICVLHTWGQNLSLHPHLHCLVPCAGLNLISKLIDHCYAKPWVINSEPSLGNAKQIVEYLAKYTHRVAISNTRIKNIDKLGVNFSFKDYADKANQKQMTLTGVEFLRRFAMHILPRGFVKIRYYGILASKYREQVKTLKSKPDIFQLTETRQQRMVRLTGHDPCMCSKCKTGKMLVVEVVLRIRSPDNVFYPITSDLNC